MSTIFVESPSYEAEAACLIASSRCGSAKTVKLKNKVANAEDKIIFSFFPLIKLTD